MTESPTSRILIYGATGYTGRLISELSKRVGINAVLAGRNPEKTKDLADQLGLEFLAFSLDDQEKLDEALRGVELVMHCAGPFIHTFKPMVEACIRTKTHYLDITGELQVFEAISRYHDQAAEAGVMLLPGTGFDVVPSDTLAARLKSLMPEATELTLAIAGIGGGVSRGTAKTMVEHMHHGSAIRKDGKIQLIPAGSKVRAFDFGRGPKDCLCIPWGDVSTAWHSTGIPNISVYSYASKSSINAMKWGGWLAGLTKAEWVKNILRNRIDNQKPGPDEQSLEKGKSFVFGEVKDGNGNIKTALFQGPQGYKLTAMTSIEIIQRVLRGDFKPGFQTPASAYGFEWLLELEGMTVKEF